MRKLFSIWLSIAGITIFINVSVLSQPYKQLEGVNLQKTQGIQVIERKLLDVNNIAAWFRNDGEFYSDHSMGPGFEWPKGSGIHAIFSSALWIGAKVFEPGVSESIRVATGGHFGSEYRPGKINSLTGLPDDYTKPEYKIYRVQPNLDTPHSNPDYLNWPIEQGAPWIDIDKDGKWDPKVDKPGIKFPAGATFPDMMLYYVYNDADSLAHSWIWGRTRPLGAEIRKTAWAYTSLPDVQFLRFEIHNKSKYNWNDAYIGIWSDPDMGNPFDDYAGCDIGVDLRGKRHDLGYCYNGDDDDNPYGYGDKPPAVGFKLMQGPIIQSNSVATAFSFGSEITGLKNLEMSSFNFICNPSNIVSFYSCNYPSGEYGDGPYYQVTYNYLQGLLWSGRPWIDKYGQETKYVFSGDPVTDVGWINKDYTDSNDVRMFVNVGPFNMSPGDSQDVIFASLIAQGSDRLNSITKLRELSTNIRYAYDNSFKNLPSVKWNSRYLSSDSTSISLKVNLQNTKIVKAILSRDKDGLQKIFQLYDDGLHSDDAANDGVFGNDLTIYQSKIPSRLSLEVEQTTGDKILWQDVATHITTAGPMQIVDFKIISDNLNADGKANPGENIRCVFGIKNLSRDTLENFAISYFPMTKNIQSYRELTPIILNANLVRNSGVFLDVAKYISFNISKDATVDETEKILFRIVDKYLNVWFDTVEIKIYKPHFPPQEIFSSQQTGEAEGAFGLRIINPELLKNHNYRITIEEIQDSTLFNLTNITTNESLLFRHPLPDELGHNIQVTDGFKITIGTTTTNKGLKNWKYTPSSNQWFTGVRGSSMDLYTDRLGFITYPRISKYTNIQSGLSIDSLRYVEIHFDKNKTQKAYRYLSGIQIRPIREIIHPEFRPFVIDSVGFGFLYQDYQQYRLGKIDSGYVVPFTVWEVDSKGNKSRQLDAGIVERNDTLYRWKKLSPVDSVKEYIYTGNVDGRWNPSPHLGIIGNKLYQHYEGDEVILIYSSKYSDTAKLQYSYRQTDMITKFPQLPLMYLVALRRTNLENDFKDGDVLRINPYYPLREGDVYLFNPIELKEMVVPSNYRLTQNYPNPFNAGTAIEYGLPAAGRVTLEVYNILGQKIAVLIDGEEKIEGNYSVNWDGRTTSGTFVSTGVYFYRISVSGEHSSFAQTKKLIVIR
ncbi:MAG: T9SS type A sorting domain-containing protein [Bacteroidota bacterium]|nr:T9SS type A sorting domain-containing protein [Bacteroidota bacterium]